MKYDLIDYVAIIKCYCFGSDLGYDQTLSVPIQQAYQNFNPTITGVNKACAYITEIIFADKQWQADTDQFDVMARVRRIVAIEEALDAVKSDARYAADESTINARIDALLNCFHQQLSNSGAKHRWQEQAIPPIAYRINMNCSSLNASTNNNTMGHVTLSHASAAKCYTLFHAITRERQPDQIGVLIAPEKPVNIQVLNQLKQRCVFYTSLFDNDIEFYRALRSIRLLLAKDYNRLMNQTGRPLPKGLLFYRLTNLTDGYSMTSLTTGGIAVLQWSSENPTRLQTRSQPQGSPDLPYMANYRVPQKSVIVLCDEKLFRLLPFNLPAILQQLPTVKDIQAKLTRKLSELTPATRLKQVTHILRDTVKDINSEHEQILQELYNAFEINQYSKDGTNSPLNVPTLLSESLKFWHQQGDLTDNLANFVLFATSPKPSACVQVKGQLLSNSVSKQTAEPPTGDTWNSTLNSSPGHASLGKNLLF